MRIRISLNIRRDIASHQLTHDIASVADDFGTYFDQLVAPAAQRPHLRRLGHRERLDEVAEVV